jgi:hypothetical protein
VAGEERPVDRGNDAEYSVISESQSVPAAPLPGGRSEAPAERAARTGIPDGSYLGLGAGERLELCDSFRLAERSRQSIFVGCGEMVVHDRVHGHHTWHYQLPGATADSSKPTVGTIVVVAIHKKPIGYRSLGTHFLCFIDPHGSLMDRLDNSVNYGHNSSDTWEFNSEELKTMCRSVGVSMRVEPFDTAADFISAHPEWTPPELEFEVDHLPTERVREWGLAIALGLPIAVGLLGAVGAIFLLVGPIGWVVKGLGVLGIVVAVGLTVWGHSRWRMKRSLRVRGLDTIHSVAPD